MILRTPFFLFIIGIAGCSSPTQDNQAALAERIEKIAQLPKGAYQLAEYGRHYAFKTPDVVTGVYIKPVPPLHADDGCDVMTDNFSSRPCTQAEIAEMKTESKNAAFMRAKAGESLWFESEADLPVIDDGGCSQVTLEYDLRSERIISIDCNGQA